MDSVRSDAVAAQVSYRLDRVDLAVDLDLEALHSFLDDLSNVAESDIYASCSDASRGGLLRCFE